MSATGACPSDQADVGRAKQPQHEHQGDRPRTPTRRRGTAPVQVDTPRGRVAQNPSLQGFAARDPSGRASRQRPPSKPRFHAANDSSEPPKSERTSRICRAAMVGSPRNMATRAMHCNIRGRARAASSVPGRTNASRAIVSAVSRSPRRSCARITADSNAATSNPPLSGSSPSSANVRSDSSIAASN